MTTFVPFIAYFGDNIVTPLSNDLIGMVLSYIDEDAVNTIKKLNNVLRDMSHIDWYFIIHCKSETGYLDDYVYDKDADYTTSLSKLRHTDIRIICWAVKYMPFLFAPDTRKRKWECWGENGKHHIEQGMHGNGMVTNRVKNKNDYNSYLITLPKLNIYYVTRIATVLSFMVSGFERAENCNCKYHKTCFKCKQVKISRRQYIKNLHIMDVEIYK
jgi:hypothetical protein